MLHDLLKNSQYLIHILKKVEIIVGINGSISKTLTTKCEVPQWSVLIVLSLTKN